MPSQKGSRRPSMAAKTTEVYGFVGSIAIVVAYWLYVVWAFVPEPWLHAIGITYYPSKYWAVVLPTYCLVVVLLGLLGYTAFNHLAKLSPDSIHTIYDEFAITPVAPSPDADEGRMERPIPSISDISLLEINSLLFGNTSKATMEARKALLDTSNPVEVGSVSFRESHNGAKYESASEFAPKNLILEFDGRQSASEGREDEALQALWRRRRRKSEDDPSSSMVS